MMRTREKLGARWFVRPSARERLISASQGSAHSTHTLMMSQQLCAPCFIGSDLNAVFQTSCQQCCVYMIEKV